MPRAIVYASRNPADEHFKALVADAPNPSSPAQLRQLRAEAVRGQSPTGRTPPLVGAPQEGDQQ
jgi:hypothetical protein